MSGLIDPTTQVLTGALDGLVRRQNLISSNLANIDTPGYRPQAIDFETALRQQVDELSAAPGNALPPSSGPSADVALLTTDPRQFSSLASSSGGTESSPSPFDGSIRNDGNRVDLESEMTALTETQIKFEGVGKLVSGKFGLIQTVLGAQ